MALIGAEVVLLFPAAATAQQQMIFRIAAARAHPSPAMCWPAPVNSLSPAMIACPSGCLLLAVTVLTRL